MLMQSLTMQGVANERQTGNRFSCKGSAPDLPFCRRRRAGAARGDFIVILGPSGSGKSTFLNIVGGLNSLKAHFQRVTGSLPEHAAEALQALIRMADGLVDEIERLESRILDWHRTNDASRRLATIPGIGPITASAIAANVPDASLFKTARQFAAWLGLTPRANSSGGKERQMGISKQGDAYIRRLLVSGASAVMRFTRQGDPGKAWLAGIKERKRPKVAAVAQANKTARIAWAILRRNEVFVARSA